MSNSRCKKKSQIPYTVDFQPKEKNPRRAVVGQIVLVNGKKAMVAEEINNDGYKNEISAHPFDNGQVMYRRYVQPTPGKNRKHLKEDFKK